MSGSLVWIDLEMTGLDPKKHRIVEIAVLATDGKLNLLPGEFEAVIRTSPAALRRMPTIVRKMHHRSGLLERIRSSRIPMARAEREALAFIRSRCRKGQGILAGNSIATDRRFLQAQMPKLEAWLHYRMVDVSTVKELVRRWYPRVPKMKKRETHTAMSDIRESIDELRYYRRRVFR